LLPGKFFKYDFVFTGNGPAFAKASAGKEMLGGGVIL
jgi:hypothetical protein